MSTKTLPASDIASEFQHLANEWRDATRFLSSPTEATEHPTYRAIIALGPTVVPILLTELAKSPEPWFAALRELTGVDPVPASDRGRPRASAEHWIKWGQANGLVG